MDKRTIALAAFFVVLLVGVLFIASTWTAERTVEPPAKPDTAQTPGVPSMQR